MTLQQERTRIVAVIEWVLLAICLVSIALFCIFAYAMFDDTAEQIRQLYGSSRSAGTGGKPMTLDEARDFLSVLLLIFIIAGIVGGLIQAAITNLLWSGVNNERLGRVKAWWIISLVILILTILGLLRDIVAGLTYIDLSSFIHLIYRIITLIVVKSYMNELSTPLGGVVYSKPAEY